MMDVMKAKANFVQIFVGCLTGIALASFLSGCASLGGAANLADDGNAPVANVAPNLTKFSDNPNLPVASQRQYKRMTKNRMEEEADLGAQAGSMWVMEGQGAYLFSQNKSRREGDLLNVKVEGPAQKQIETKVSVIKKLLKQLETDAIKAQEVSDPNSRGLASEKPGQGATPTAIAAEPDKEKSELGEVTVIPTRIIERLVDGNYRVKGAQPFMIGKKEYKVLVTGIVRPEDFNDEGISANKLLDPQFDVVNIRRSGGRE